MEDQHNSTEPSAELEGYTCEELTIHAGKAQLQAIGYAMPLLILFGGAFFLWWDRLYTTATSTGWWEASSSHSPPEAIS